MNRDSMLAPLIDAAHALDLALTTDQIEKLKRYCHELHQTNRRFNLTGARTPEAIVQTLLVDSLALDAAIRQVIGQNVPNIVDVGSGAGIPGIPLAILHPNARVVLIESVGKKARFQREVVAALGLDQVSVRAERSEEAARDPVLRDSAALAVARAVAPLPALVELCAPFVLPGGFLALPKSGNIAVEVAAARAAERVLRLEYLDAVPVPEPLGLGSGRATVVYRKIGPTPDTYPRRAGLAGSRPIGSVSPSRP